MACLTEFQLLRLDAGELSSEERRAVEEHLDTCSQCAVWTSELLRIGQTTRSRILPEPGSLFSRYLVLEREGGGAMAEVYGAYDPLLERRIALKFLRTNRLDGRENEARLIREAQALARLNHPNVVAVYEAGTHEGQPFVALEWVQGETLSRWLHTKPRSWREVLSVFLPAGRGLAAAHRAGLIHRDFKPDNVLMGVDGRVRVSDFGLARTWTPAEGEQPRPGGPADPSGSAPTGLSLRLTAAGTVSGTPAYMAPEVLDGQLPTPASDQFSFAVALFEALCGQRPFAEDSLAVRAEAARKGQLREVWPNNVPSWLRRAVEKGLAPSPDARHPSVEALVEILSRVPERRRRRAGLAAGLAVVAGLIGVAYFLGVRRPEQLCGGGAELLAQVWNGARAERIHSAFGATGRDIAEAAYSQTRQALEAYANAWLAGHREACLATRVRGELSDAVLDRRMLCLEDRRRRLSATLELFEKADGEVMSRALDAARALPEVAACADWSRLSLRPLPPSLPELRTAAAEAGATVARAAALMQAGRYREAGALALTGATQAREAQDLWSAAEGYLVAAQAQTRDGSSEQAEPSCHEAIIAAEASGHLDVQVEARGLLAYSVGRAFLRWTEAERWLRQAEALLAFQSVRPRATSGGGAGREGAGVLEAKVAFFRASVDEAAGRFSEALAGGHRALSLLETASAAESQEAGRTLLLLGIVAEGLGKRDDAIAYKRQALERFQRALGAFHPEVARTLGNLAASYSQAGGADEAIALHRQAVALLESGLGPEHLHVATAVGNLGTALKRWGNPVEAEAALRRSIQLGEARLGPEDPFSASALHNLGGLLLDQGRPAEALPVLQRALALKAKAGPDHPSLSSTYVNLGETYRALAKPQEALEAYQRALSVAEKAAGPQSPRLVYSLVGLASTHLVLGAPGKALPVAERAFDLTEQGKVDPWARPMARLTRARAVVAARLEVARGEREARLALDEAKACGKGCEKAAAEALEFLESLGAAPRTAHGSDEATSRRGKLTSRRLETKAKSD